MFDRFNRPISYLRISVTDRCNLRCQYCMRTNDVRFLPESELLTLDEVVQISHEALKLGFQKIRLTGGEPLLRPDLLTIVERISRLNVADLSMTTNGVLLGKMATSLKSAGLMRVNVSLDSVNPLRYHQITKGGDLRSVLGGIESALAADLAPVKLNCVIKQSPDESDALGVLEFANRLGVEARFIREMDLERGEFHKVTGGSGGDCDHCDRLRLTANGLLRPCLFNNIAYSIREHGPRQALALAIENKPERGGTCSVANFSLIGG